MSIDLILSELNSMPTLRPYVRAALPGMPIGYSGDFISSANQFVIDDVMDPETSKFKNLRSFEFSMLTGPEQVKITLFDETGGHIRTALEQVYKAPGVNTDPASGGRAHMSFEWGYAKPNGERIRSSMHNLMIYNIEFRYEDGGISWQIIGADCMTHMQGVINKDGYAQCTVRDAIRQLLVDNIDKPSMCEPNFGDDALGNGPADEVEHHWNANGNNILEIIQGWMQICLSKRGRALYAFWDSTSNTLNVHDINPADSNESPVIYGPHDINYWRRDRGSIVIKFSPTVSGIQQMAALSQASIQDQGQRIIPYETLKNKQAPSSGSGPVTLGPDGAMGGGIQIHVANKAASSVSDRENARRQAEGGNEINRNFGVSARASYLAANANLECLGWPQADKYGDVLLRTMNLRVYNPYYLAGTDTFKPPLAMFGWQSSGLETYLSGDYVITAIKHIIDDSGYRMNIDVNRWPSDPKTGTSDPPFKEPTS